MDSPLTVVAALKVFVDVDKVLTAVSRCAS